MLLGGLAEAFGLLLFAMKRHIANGGCQLAM
jgi:hypothetical protein